MLRALHVQNFVLIDDLTLDLAGGFHALTGETGAGKSLLIDALTMLSGARAQKDWVRHGAKEAVVEATFDVSQLPMVRSVLDSLGVVHEDELLLRRVVNAEGRSRVVIGGQMASVGELTRVASALFRICGQNAHYELAKEDTALLALDRFAGLEGAREEFAKAHAGFSAARRELAALTENESQRLQRLDYVNFQLNELEEAGVQVGEEDELKSRRGRLAHAEKLSAGFGVVSDTLSGDEGVVNRLQSVRQRLRDLVKFDATIAVLLERCESVLIEVDDLASSVDSHANEVTADPSELDKIEARLALYSRLTRKHGCSCDALGERRAALRAERDGLAGADERKDELQGLVSAAGARMEQLGEALSRKRQVAAKKLSEDVLKMLRPLAMPKADFAVAVQSVSMKSEQDRVLAHATGFDRVEFELAANLGEPRRPIGKVASGGELSRVSLAIEAVLGESAESPTYLFDEVDAGVGGAVAERVGQALARLSKQRQVLCVTHHAQIAALSDVHYRVEKKTTKGRTISTLTRLDDTTRADELARMLGGVEVSDVVRKHAAELLESRVH